jgi:peptide/nickel transport system substrate-binding protein
MPVRNRFAVPVAAMAVISLALGACGTDDKADTGSSTNADSTLPAGVTTQNLGEEGTPTDGGKVVVALESDTDSGFNPASSQWANSGHMIASAIYDPLVSYDADAKAVPFLAESVEPNADFTAWTIAMRPNVKFHNGEVLTADAVKVNLDALRTSFVTGASLRTIDTITVTGDLTLELTMSAPWSTFPYMMTSQAGYIAAPETMTSGEAMTATAMTNPIGTGPFTFRSWTLGQPFIADKFPEYWQAGKPHLDEIEFRVITDAQQRTDALLSGEVDMIHTFVPREIRRLRGTDVKMIEYGRGEKTFVQLNNATAPFNELSAREAVAYATDAQRFLDETDRALLAPPTGPFVTGQLGFEIDSGFPAYDLQKAKDKVAEYTATTGEDLSFTYRSQSTPDAQAASQILQKMWQEAGMKVELATESQAAEIISAALGEFQAVEWRNFGQPDPDAEYVWWTSPSVQPVGSVALNFARFSDPELDAAMDRARTTLDRDARDAEYKQVARRLSAGVPYVWLEQNIWALAANARVNGFKDATNGSLQTLGAKTWVADLWVSR